jgi:hypothetical protein
MAKRKGVPGRGHHKKGVSSLLIDTSYTDGITDNMYVGTEFESQQGDSAREVHSGSVTRYIKQSIYPHVAEGTE